MDRTWVANALWAPRHDISGVGAQEPHQSLGSAGRSTHQATIERVDTTLHSSQTLQRGA